MMDGAISMYSFQYRNITCISFFLCGLKFTQVTVRKNYIWKLINLLDTSPCYPVLVLELPQVYHTPLCDQISEMLYFCIT